MIQKTRALALLAGAAIQHAAGQHQRAAAMLTAATQDPTLSATLRAIAGATASTTAAKKGVARALASSWPYSQRAGANDPGLDMRVEVDHGEGLRETEEGSVDDDLEDMGLGEYESAAFPFEKEGDDEEDDGGKEDARAQRATANARAARKAFGGGF